MIVVRQHNLELHSAQAGFVLVLSLVMLAVLTLIGVSSMNTANMELKATANARQHLAAFNAAQTMLEYSVSKPVVLARTIDYQTNKPADFPQVINPAAATLKLTDISDQEVSVALIGCTVAPGSSLEEGRGFSYTYFSVNGTASNSSGTATSLMSQGARYPAAACTGGTIQ